MSITHETSLENFHQQIHYVLSTYTAHGLRAASFRNVVIGGLGGSGIGGRLARLFFLKSSSIPVEVFNEYELPAYADANTLLILCSYSGDTEETLSMYNDAVKRGCTIICMASGGKLKEIALQNQLKFYSVETGFQPRMALGYSFTTLIMVLDELFGQSHTDALKEVASVLQNPANDWKKEGEKMADYFQTVVDQKFVVVCDLPFEAAAIRFCQQIQENAKGEAFISVLPEANHNMIESYYQTHHTNFIFVNSNTNPRVSARFDFLKKHLDNLENTVYTFSIPEYNLQSIYRFIHSTDWLSIHASNIKNENNMEVSIISRLKKFLSDLS